MSNVGLSDHSCLVYATIAYLLFASSTFRRICTSAESQDYTESRQFRKNLAVSKYRNNTHWLPNYVWKPAEKYHGTRKKPAWEVEEVIESEADKRKREEHEEWERKMREVTRRQREKWQNNEAEETDYPDKIIVPSTDIEETPKDNSSSKVPMDDEINDPRNVSMGLNKNLHNGRWGMSVGEPAEGSFKDNPRSLDSISVRGLFQQTTVKPNKPKCLIRGNPKKIWKNAPKRPEIHEAHDTLKLHDNDGIDNDRWEIKEEAVMSGLSDESANDYSSFRRSIDSKNFEKEDAMPMDDSNGPWANGPREPIRDFPMDKSQTTRKITGRGLEENGNRRPWESAKIFNDVENRREKIYTRRGFVKLPNGLPNGRWDINESSSRREFPREISEHGNTEITRFYEPETQDRFIDYTKARNDHRPRDIFSRMPKATNKFKDLNDVFGSPISTENPENFDSCKSQKRNFRQSKNNRLIDALK